MSSKSDILENYTEFITYGFTNPMPDSEIGPWKITAKDVIDGEINFSTARKTTKDAFENNLTEKSRPKKGDVLCSGLMYPDTDLGENTRHGEVFDEQAKTYIFL